MSRPSPLLFLSCLESPWLINPPFTTLTQIKIRIDDFFGSGSRFCENPTVMTDDFALAKEGKPVLGSDTTNPTQLTRFSLALAHIPTG